MTFASVCSGIEAASVAFLPLGWKCAFRAEIEPFPCAVLKHHYPETPNYGDITKFQEWPEHAIDVLIAGSPCQSFSIAGQRAGISDPRGNLALVFLGIVAKYRPAYVVWENVPGVHSSWTDEKVRAPTFEEKQELRRHGLDPNEYEYFEQSNDFDSFLSGLESLQYGIATAILDAQYFGLAQRRERVFAVGCAGGQWQRAAAILADAESMSGNLAPSRNQGQSTSHEIAHCIGASGRGFERSGDTRGQDCLVAGALQERDSKGADSNTKPGHLIPFDTTQITSKVNRSNPDNGGGVRRLSVIECEFLQGFPRNYTRIPWRGKPAEECPDGPRYRALGNAMAVPVVAWIGKQIEAVDKIK